MKGDDTTLVKLEKNERQYDKYDDLADFPTKQQPIDKILQSDDITVTPFMPKMGNETLKAQLGNAAWKLFHTILARYPVKPTQLEKTTLSQYIHLFAQVYPCGDCARHFQQLLEKYPPQVSSRQIAAMWGCMVHNKVNESLNKDIYDCMTILEDYDCGCAKDEEDELEITETEGRQKGG